MFPIPIISTYGNNVTPIEYDQYQNNNTNILSGTANTLTTNSVFAQNGPRGCSYKDKVYLAGINGNIMYINGNTDTYTVLPQRPVQVRNAGICANGTYLDNIVKTIAAVSGSTSIGPWGNNSTVGDRFVMERFRLRSGVVWNSSFNLSTIYPSK